MLRLRQATRDDLFECMVFSKHAQRPGALNLPRRFIRSGLFSGVGV